MTKAPKKPAKHVKALIDKHVVQGELKRMGLLRRLFGPAEMRHPDDVGTRRHRRK
jgi:hypothetical protein